MAAYATGIFPMSESRDDPEVFWVDPKRRGIIPLDGFHISRSLAKSMCKGGYEVSINRDFSGTVAACADRPETWINDTIFDLYLTLHHRGVAHSLEIWSDTKLVGGVYGVAIGSAFFGESMFSRQKNMSKIALAHLVDWLRLGGFTLFDTQFLTDHLASLGAQEISRSAYKSKLKQSIRVAADFSHCAKLPTAQEVIQRNTQTS